MKLAVFDIGGTSLKMGVVTDQGDMLASDKVDNAGSREAILEDILSWLQKNPGCEGVAVSVPGFIDPRSGFVSMGGTVRAFDNFHLSKWLTEQTSLPATVENDAHCALLAERWLGKAQSMSDFLMITIGTGLGGAAFCNDALMRGKGNRAGEFGCLLVARPAGGSVSRYTMGENCTMTALRESYAQHTGRAVEEVSGKDVFSAWDSEEPVATRLVTTFYQDLCAGIYNLANTFDPDCIFLGGGITEREAFLQEVKFHLAWFGKEIPVETATFGNDSGMLGAAYHFLQSRER